MAFFDPSEVKDDNDIIPVGEYECLVENIDLKPNNAGTGDVIKVTLVVTGDICNGRKIFDNLNFVHENPSAQEIGRKLFARMIKAVFGEPRAIEDLQELDKKPVGVRITHKKDRNNEMRANVAYIRVDEVKPVEKAPF